MTQDSSGSTNVTEVVRFGQFEQNDEEADTFGVTKRLNGCLRSYHGLRLNSDDGSPSTDGVWVQDWLSLAHHTAFQNSPDYPPFVARASSFTNPELIEIRHVSFQPHLIRAFSATLTEISIITLAPTFTSDAFESLVKEAQANFDALSYGTIVEDASHKTYQIVNGWQSVEKVKEAHLSHPFYQRLREVAEVVTGIYKLAE